MTLEWQLGRGVILVGPCMGCWVDRGSWMARQSLTQFDVPVASEPGLVGGAAALAEV